VNESNDPAEQQPWEPDAKACFVEAAANLRVAERMLSNVLGHDMDRANSVIYVADAWTRLGTALDSASGFDPAYPIPVQLVENPPTEVEQPHLWPSMGPTVCERCGFGPSEVGPQCVGDPLPMNHAHTFVPESGPMCTHLGCNVLLPELTEKLMSSLRLTTPPRLEDSAPLAPPHTHKWNLFSTVCRVLGCGITWDQAEIRGEHNQPPTLPMTPDHEHTGACRHRWETPSSPCAHGCGAMLVGGSGPTEVCPEACPGFTT
jgi:hypothetical protein